MAVEQVKFGRDEQSIKNRQSNVRDANAIKVGSAAVEDAR